MILTSISQSEQMADLPDEMCRIVATWTIPHLDREGRITGSARRLRVIAVPLLGYTDGDVERAIEAMCAGVDPMAVRYTDASGQLVLWFPKFKEAQKGARFDREAPSRFGAPPPPVRTDSKECGSESPLTRAAARALTSIPFSSASPDPDAREREPQADEVRPGLVAALVRIFPDLGDDAEGFVSELVGTYGADLDYVFLAKDARLWKQSNPGTQGHTGMRLLRKWSADAHAKRQAVKAKAAEVVAQVGAAKPDYHGPARLKSSAELDALAAESFRLEEAARAAEGKG